MSEKTYNGLEEKAAHTLLHSNQELRIMNRISKIFFPVSNEEKFVEILQLVLSALKSKFGLFGYIDPNNNTLVLPAITKDVWKQCNMPGKDTRFPHEKWNGLWGRALKEKRSVCSNTQLKVPKGHIEIKNSMAVPIIHERTIIGLLLVANKETDFTQEDQSLLETIASHIATHLNTLLQHDMQEKERNKAEETLQRKNQLLNTLNTLLNLSMRPVGLEEIFSQVVIEILSVPWLALQSKGAVFLVEEDPRQLILKTHHGLSEELAAGCTRIPFGYCLCGKAASTKQIQFADCIDKRHDRRYKNIQPHGHYCVPIKSSDKILGILNLYVKEGHPQTKEEKDFLLAVANCLAGIIERKKAEAALIKNEQYLENLVKKRTSELTRVNKQLEEDIQTRKEAEKALCFEREKLRKLYENSPDAIVLLSKDYNILYANHHTETITQIPLKKIKGKKCYEAILEKTSPCEGCLLEEVLREKTTKDRIKHEITAAGAENWLWQIWYPVINQSGEIDCVVEIARDITEAKKTEETLKQSEERFRTIFENANDGIIVVDPRTKKIILTNSKASELLGYSKEELQTFSIEDIHPPDNLPFILKQFNKIITGETTVARNTPVLKKDSTIIYCDISASWSHFAGKKLVVGFFRDITDQVKIAETLRTEGKLAQKYLDIAGVMFVVINADQTVSLINKKGCEILGYKESEIVGKNWLDNFIPERIRSQVQFVYNKLLSGEIASIEYYDNPVLTKRGEERVIFWHNTILKNEKGEIVSILSSGTDVTERRRTEKALKRSEEEYRSLVENINIGIYRATGGPQGKFLQANPAMAKMFGYKTVEDLMEICPSDLHQDPTKRKLFMDELLKKGFVRNKELKLRKKDGTPIWASCSTQVKYDQNGEIEWIDGVIEDITKRKRAEQRLKYEAIHDSLTGLFNRGYFMERLKTAIHSARRHDSPLSVCLCDLDNLKPINDTHGHQVGDEVLATFGKILLEELRGEDVPGRYGGDEFFMLFPNVSASQATASVERIRQRFQEHVFPAGNNASFSTSATFAVADLTEEHENGKDLLNCVDKILYKAKDLGRNCVITVGKS